MYIPLIIPSSIIISYMILGGYGLRSSIPKSISVLCKKSIKYILKLRKLKINMDNKKIFFK